MWRNVSSVLSGSAQLPGQARPEVSCVDVGLLLNMVIRPGALVKAAKGIVHLLRHGIAGHQIPQCFIRGPVRRHDNMVRQLYSMHPYQLLQDGVIGRCHGVTGV
jgi:hypothetical protein